MYNQLMYTFIYILNPDCLLMFADREIHYIHTNTNDIFYNAFMEL